MDVRCWGASELHQREKQTRFAWCLQSSRSRLQYHVTHSAAKIKHVRTLLTAAASGTTNTFFPALLLFLFSFFFSSSSSSSPHVCLPLIRVKRVSNPLFSPPSPPELDTSHLCSDNAALCCCSLSPKQEYFMDFYFGIFCFCLQGRGGGRGGRVLENNVIINTACALEQWDLRARRCVW